MGPDDSYLDQSTAIYQELQAQLADFDGERFKRFYLAYIAERRDAAGDADEMQVDFLNATFTYTIPTCTLDVGIFGSPHDELLTSDGNLTELAGQAVKRLSRFRRRMLRTLFSGQIPSLQSMMPITEVNTTFYAGRRSLGGDKFQAFKALVAKKTKMSLTESARLRLRVRSFDTIVDQAMTVALKPIPFPNQNLLKTLLESESVSVIGMALVRLDKTPENGRFFDRFLAQPMLLTNAAPGACDLELLNAQLARVSSPADAWNASCIRTRLAILNGDRQVIEETASTPTYFHSVYMALEAIDDRATLTRVRERLRGDTPRDVQGRLIIDTKLASLDGDLARVEEAFHASPEHQDDMVRQILATIRQRLRAALDAAPEVFISYKHESEDHKRWVRTLAEDLRRNGVNALLDEWELELGGSVADYGAAGIFRSSAMLFVITPASVAAVETDERQRSAVKFEFQIANARRYKDGNFRLIGLLRAGERPPNHLADTLYLDFRRDEEYEQRLKQLVRGLLNVSTKPAVVPSAAAGQ